MFAERMNFVGEAVAAHGRRIAKTVAEAALPRSVAVWRGPARSSRVALTFDDGPTAMTLDYLDVLEHVGARATFFVIGNLCATHPGILADITRRGHEVAGHGYTHRTFPKLSRLGLLADELDKTARLLPPSAPRRPIVRPPQGAISLTALATCARSGFTTVFWSLDSGDWRTTRAADVVEAVVGRPVDPGAIVLFHEGQSWTLDALRAIVGNLRDAGHQMVTVGELLGR
jgi:peptidoglycan/xylan/chitin deacetylase (PgdA/CDA1 family)